MTALVEQRKPCDHDGDHRRAHGSAYLRGLMKESNRFMRLLKLAIYV